MGGTKRARIKCIPSFLSKSEWFDGLGLGVVSLFMVGAAVSAVCLAALLYREYMIAHVLPKVNTCAEDCIHQFSVRCK